MISMSMQAQCMLVCSDLRIGSGDRVKDSLHCLSLRFVHERQHLTDPVYEHPVRHFRTLQTKTEELLQEHTCISAYPKWMEGSLLLINGSHLAI